MKLEWYYIYHTLEWTKYEMGKCSHEGYPCKHCDWVDEVDMRTIPEPNDYRTRDIPTTRDIP